jgi:hypothetical protein
VSDGERERRLEDTISTLNGLIAKLPQRRQMTLEEAYAEIDRLMKKVRRERKRKKRKDGKDKSDSAGV